MSFGSRSFSFARRGHGLRLTLAAAALGLAALAPAAAHADDDLELERSLGEFVVIDNQQLLLERGEVGAARHPGVQSQTVNNQHADIAVLPQLGVDPQAGVILGVKFSAIHFTQQHLNLDIGATQSTRGETDVDLKLGTPHLLGSDYIGQARIRYQLSPRQKFYGLGNNSVGENPLTQHEYHAASFDLTVARRMAPHLLLAGTIGFDRTSIGPGKPRHGRMSTGQRFPRLPGLASGNNNPLSLVAIYNTQRDLTRPQQGWNVIGKLTHVGPELGNTRYHYTRFIADASYLQPLGSPDHLLGFRIDGEHVAGRGDRLPFYAFASIGGEMRMPGYQPHRFLGQDRVFVHLGYQQLLAQFNFRDIWHVRLDGTVFAGTGRVFLHRSRLPARLLADTPDVAPGLKSHLRFDYGVGLHIALGQALSARLIAGFSPESKGLVYLTFGNQF